MRLAALEDGITRNHAAVDRAVGVTEKEKTVSKSANPTGTKPVKEQSQKEFEAYVKHDQRRQDIDRSSRRGR